VTEDRDPEVVVEGGSDPASQRVHVPIRRAYAPITGRGDVDQRERAMRFRLAVLSLAGAVMGFLLGVFMTVNDRGGAFVIPLLTLVGWVVAYFGPLTIMTLAARAGSTFYNPSGKTTPWKREYSLAESYLARGQIEAAIDAFEEAIAENPTDPTPYARVARVHRDVLSDPAHAAHWFRRALSESAPEPRLRRLLREELLEVYEVRLGEARRALPMLSRIAEEEMGTPDGVWAAAELERLREMDAGGDGRSG
jgi:tetratricopeptide (TPR) repeat protein